MGARQQLEPLRLVGLCLGSTCRVAPSVAGLKACRSWPRLGTGPLELQLMRVIGQAERLRMSVRPPAMQGKRSVSLRVMLAIGLRMRPEMQEIGWGMWGVTLVPSSWNCSEQQPQEHCRLGSRPLSEKQPEHLILSQ